MKFSSTFEFLNSFIFRCVFENGYDFLTHATTVCVLEFPGALAAQDCESHVAYCRRVRHQKLVPSPLWKGL